MPEQPGDKEKQPAQEQLPFADRKDVTKQISWWNYFDNFSKLIAGIAFVCWITNQPCLDRGLALAGNITQESGEMFHNTGYANCKSLILLV